MGCDQLKRDFSGACDNLMNSNNFYHFTDEEISFFYHFFTLGWIMGKSGKNDFLKDKIWLDFYDHSAIHIKNEFVDRTLQRAAELISKSDEIFSKSFGWTLDAIKIIDDETWNEEIDDM